MRIEYDNIIYSLQNAGGISTYWSQLCNRLIRDNYSVTFVERKTQSGVRMAVDIAPEKIDNDNIFPLIISRFITLKYSRINEKFIFHSSYNRVTNHPKALQIVTIHDFVHEKFYSGIRRFLHKFQKNRAIRSADAIIAVSENTKRDLLHFHPYIKPENVHVIYNGVSEDFCFLNPEQYRLIDISDTYFLYIGSREKYKNFDFTVEAVSLQQDHYLYIVGSELTNAEVKILDSKLKGRWRLFKYAENKLLNELYNRAFALVYPSSYEGFGIPLLEAMSAGCPFITLNNSSIPEVAGKAGAMMMTLSLSEFHDAVRKIYTLRGEMINRGFEQVRKFSWEKCYQETLQVYKNVYHL